MSIKVTLSLYILAVECRLIMHTEKDPKTDEKVKLHCHEYTDCDSCLSHSDITKNPCEWCASENRCLPYINFCPLPSRTQFTFNCPRPLEELPFYNETFARLYVLPMIASVYAANDSATKCHSFMAYLPDEDAIALLFQSEIDREFYMQQLNAMKNPKMIDLPAIGGALLMEYHDAFQRLWAMMRDDLYGALNYTNGTSDIWANLQIY
ncbi:unnamed protein product [Thelazia callipaeda]|uniref:PSI_integrin domain-containing protein n=1 Tax=Thelazia callipaeda TaxID=103827 RepID=A0A0N5CY32_THECL|nr:unnamed protein product [Thelazia callipaeda]